MLRLPTPDEVLEKDRELRGLRVLDEPQGRIR
jgi:hypothetical protein